MSSWQEKVAACLRSQVSPGARILVAVSGGPDSVALSHFLRSQPYSLVMGHIDHGLRPGSARDARFVRKLASQWDIPCFIKSARVRSFATDQKMGLEEAARTLRYRLLGQMAKNARCMAVLTAHTANDQAETVLMNFLRGAGPSGLAGIPPVRSLNGTGDLLLIRPFLETTRRDVEDYIQRNRLSYRKDPTNASLKFTRNRIRKETLPYLEKLYPGLSARLLQMADIFRKEEEFWAERVMRLWDKTVRRRGARFLVVLPQLLRYHKALGRRILRRAFPGRSFQDIEEMLRGHK